MASTYRNVIRRRFLMRRAFTVCLANRFPRKVHVIFRKLCSSLTMDAEELLAENRTAKDVESLKKTALIVELPKPVTFSRADAAWEYFRKLGSPRYYVAPMVDQSELPFRMLCRKYGAEAAYTPMLHSRLFSEEPKYRREFTTCPEDRPLLVQFCANNPDTLLAAAKLVEDDTDYVDINFGCPQRIAKRGNYGAYLMDDLPLVQSLVHRLSSSGSLKVPVSCKIRIFPHLEDTLRYAQMLESAGCALLAVHGRTRDQRNQREIRADWDAIKAVRATVGIPVLANGNVRDMRDVWSCMRHTGAQGVLSADSLLEYPALFSHRINRNKRQFVNGKLNCLNGQSNGLNGQFNCQNGQNNCQNGQINSQTDHGKYEDKINCQNGQTNWQNGQINYQNGQTNSHFNSNDISDELFYGERICQLSLAREYLDECEKYPVSMRMVRAHFHKLLGSKFRRFPHVREELNQQNVLTLEWLRELIDQLESLEREEREEEV